MHETPKLSNQNAVFIEYDVLIGSVLLKSFMTVQAEFVAAFFGIIFHLLLLIQGIFIAHYITIQLL
jgi:hypothetical protein